MARSAPPSTDSDSSVSGDGVRTITAEAVSEIVGGELRGDRGAVVSGVAPLDRAAVSDISFLAAPRYVEAAERTRAGILLVSRELADTVTAARATIVVDKPHDAVLTLLPRLYVAAQRVPGVHPTARLGRGARIGSGVSVEEYVVIGAGAVVGDGVWIGPHAVVGDGARIGKDSVLYAHSTIYSGSELGERVKIQSGARIGSDGFGYVFRDGAHQPIPHVGRCVLENDVDVGANTTIDRGSVDDTVIGAGTKIDNLVQIGHNAIIGKHCILVACVAVAGSAVIGDYVIIGAQVGIAGHVKVGSQARLAARCGVTKDLEGGKTYLGFPAVLADKEKKRLARINRLDQLFARVQKLEKDGEIRTEV